MALRHGVEHRRGQLVRLRGRRRPSRTAALPRQPARCPRQEHPAGGRRVGRPPQRAPLRRVGPIVLISSTIAPGRRFSRRPLSTSTERAACSSETIVTTMSAMASPAGSCGDRRACGFERGAAVRRAVPDDEREARGEHVARHRAAHPADPCEADGHHDRPLRRASLTMATTSCTRPSPAPFSPLRQVTLRARAGPPLERTSCRRRGAPPPGTS